MTAEASGDESDVRTTVASVLADHPVSVGILFGSRAQGEEHEHSDIDIAVALESVKPGEPQYNDVFFGLSADVASALDTDDVDVIDLRRAPPSLARAVFEEGTVLVGTDSEIEALRTDCLGNADGKDDEAERSAAERFDDVLAAIDDHLA